MNKTLKVEWNQKEGILSIKISSKEIQDYYLKLKESAIVIGSWSEESNKINISLYAAVLPNKFFHEKIGNTIYIKIMKKNVFCTWPRLTRFDEKNTFITQFSNSKDESENIYTSSIHAGELKYRIRSDDDHLYDDVLKNENMI
jgi:hypothetical protein